MEEVNYIEEIGKIKLNLVHYPGEDLYCDGDIEDELLSIARDRSTVEYPGIIEDRKSWPILYHLSAQRENIVEWLPIAKDMKVLEVGSGCGAITGALARKAGKVDCIELSKKRSMINAYRHMDCENITIHVGNFQDVEPDLACDYDYICLIGVFEYGQAYIRSETPYEDFLNIIKKHLKAGGRIVIAIENKFGLKYWAGCREDHLGTYFSGLEDYPDGGVVRTFTRDGLLNIAAKCGFPKEQQHMYYPYPDYKFMTSLYSDARLPEIGELSSNLRNFDRDRLSLFDEKRVFDTILKEKQFPLFSNSYLLLLGEKPDMQYVKYSNDRAEEFKIKTVLRNFGQKREIEKYPLSDEAGKHIIGTYHAYEKLKERYEGSELFINNCSLKETDAGSPYLLLEYIEGTSLEELFDKRLEKGDIEGFYRLFDEYLERIAYNENQKTSDYDLIFSNILVEDDGSGRAQSIPEECRWHVIDYEWTFDKSIEAKEIAFRAVYCYLLENEKRNKLNLERVMDRLDISQSDAEQYRRQESRFQKYVTGKRMSLPQIREAIACPVYTLEAFCEGQAGKEERNRVQIYEDTGLGFREEESFFLDEMQEEQRADWELGKVEFAVAIRGGRRALRIDPCSDFCIVYLKEILWNGYPVSDKGKQIQVNGSKVGDNTYVFVTQDPNITLSLENLKREESNMLQVAMEVTRLPEETAKHMQKRRLF